MDGWMDDIGMSSVLNDSFGFIAFSLSEPNSMSGG
jgi:hypothetical protein